MLCIGESGTNHPIRAASAAQEYGVFYCSESLSSAFSNSGFFAQDQETEEKLRQEQSDSAVDGCAGGHGCFTDAAAPLSWTSTLPSDLEAQMANLKLRNSMT